MKKLVSRPMWFMGEWGRWIRHGEHISDKWWGHIWAFYVEKHYRRGWFFSYGRGVFSSWYVRATRYSVGGEIYVRAGFYYFSFGYSTNL